MHLETPPLLSVRDDRGMVVVEAALVIPVLLAVTVLLVWVTSVGATYVRLLDVAQTAARQAARGVTALDGPPGVELLVGESDGLVRVEARDRISPPMLGFTGWEFTVSAQAHAVPEWSIVDGVEPAW
ncbi:MAG: TadE family type IV pilus minor pilin [Candidatus Nanopelagicales bacterium]|jgi:hypothetical protein